MNTGAARPGSGGTRRPESDPAARPGSHGTERPGSDRTGRPDDPGWRAVPPVGDWERTLANAGWTIDALKPLNLLARRNGSPLFALLEARGTDPEAHPMLPYVLLRGPAVVVVPLCVNRDTGARRFLMIRQRRAGDGTLSLEFPAGMIDPGESPAAAAARELEEETGLRVDPSALAPLWNKSLTSSPGLSDEAITFYAARVELDDAAFRALDGRAAGHAPEGERITTALLTREEALPEITSLQPLTGFLLFDLYEQSGSY